MFARVNSVVLTERQPLDIAKLARHALYRSLVEDVACSKSYASELASGQRKPGLGQAAKIEEAIGLPAIAWTRDPCRAFWEVLIDREIAKRNGDVVHAS